MRFAYASGSRPLEGYTIKRGIGAGGFGEVYFAMSDAGKEVALKRIQRNLDVELRGVRQCMNLKHVNLIALWDIRYDDRDEAWVVMEYISGESLKDIIDRNPNGMPIEQVHNIFRGIVAGVTYLHDHGLVHRDLKPGNIFLDEQTVKIGDYGLSKFISCSRRSGQTESVGTFHYMAPEIGKGVYGKEIDVYALAVMLYEMLTGHVPFDGESSQEIIMKHLTAEPDLSKVASPYREIIRQALAKDPDRRIANVAEMDLDAVNKDAWQDPVEAVQFPVGADAPEPVIDAEPDTLYIRDEEIVLGDVREKAAPSASSGVAGGQQVEQASAALAGEEPIARAVKRGWHRLSDWWFHAAMSTPLKVVLLVGVALLLVLNSEWLVPLSIFLAAVYLIYFGLRALFLAWDSGRCTKPRPPRPRGKPVSAPAWRTLKRQSKKQRLQQAIRNRSPIERLTELSGSMLLSAVVCGILCLIMLALGGQEFDGSVETWSFYAWLSITSTLGAWMVLAMGKIWEGNEGDEVRRRFVFLVLGVILGIVAFVATDWLLLQPSPELNAIRIKGLWQDAELPGGMLAANGDLKLPAFLVFFAGLFVFLRWWRQTDPLRRTRLSVWATGLCVLWGLILPFPQPSGMVVAGVIAVAVQVAAPWISPQERAELCER